MIRKVLFLCMYIGSPIASTIWFSPISEAGPTSWSCNLSSHQTISGTCSILNSPSLGTLSFVNALLIIWCPKLNMSPDLTKEYWISIHSSTSRCVGLLSIISHCWLTLSWWSLKSLRYFSHDFLPKQSLPLWFCHFFFFAHKCQTLHLSLLNCILLFLTQHSNLSGSLWVLILSPLVLTLPPRFVTSTPLISMPPEFSSSDKSDMIKDGALRTQKNTLWRLTPIVMSWKWPL